MDYPSATNGLLFPIGKRVPTTSLGLHIFEFKFTGGRKKEERREGKRGRRKGENKERFPSRIPSLLVGRSWGEE